MDSIYRAWQLKASLIMKGQGTQNPLTNVGRKRKHISMRPGSFARTTSTLTEVRQERPGSWFHLGWNQFLSACAPPTVRPKLWPAVVTAFFISLVFLTLPSAPPDLGVDSGWCAVLNWAHQRGLQFGKDVVFTYGPLGFLVTPYYFGQSPSILVAVNTLLCFQVAVGLCWVAWRLGPVWRYLLLGIFVFESANVESRVDLAFEVGFLCWGLLCIIESGRWRKLCAASWIALIVFAALSKVTYAYLGGFSVCAVGVYLVMSRDKWLAMAMLLGFAGVFSVAWLACGQVLSNLGPFLLNGFLISQGYDQAAGLEGLPMLRAGGGLLGAVALATILLRTPIARGSSERDARWRQTCVMGWLLGLLFVVWKHSIVRVDRYHIIELAVFSPVVTLALETLPGTVSRFRWGARWLAIASCLISLVVLEDAFLPGALASCREPFRQFAFHLRCVTSPNDWKRQLEPTLEQLRHEAQLPELRKLIGTATVDVFGSLQAYGVLNDLNYRPRPVFQSYAAYSARLARLNEEFYLSDQAPDYVLFEVSAPEHRFPTLNDAPALRALLINYEPVGSEEPFLLLKRQTKSPARLTRLHEGTIAPGEQIGLSQYGAENLWMELEISPSWIGRFVGRLTRPATIRLAAWRQTPAGTKLIARGRAAAPLLRIGFVASPCLLKLQDVRDFYAGEPFTRPDAYSVELSPESKRCWKREVRFRVYKIENQLKR